MSEEKDPLGILNKKEDPLGILGDSLKKKEPTTVESEISLPDSKEEPTVLKSPYSGAFGQKEVSPQAPTQLPLLKSTEKKKIDSNTYLPLGADKVSMGGSVSELDVRKEEDKKIIANQKTSSEKKKEQQDIVQQSGLELVYGQDPKTSLPVSKKPEEKEFSTKLLIKDKENSEAYSDILDSYIKNLGEVYPERYKEILDQSMVGLTDKQKYGVLSNAFSYEYQKLINDKNILDARGDDKIYGTYQKLAEDLNNLYEKYDVNLYLNVQQNLNNLANQYNIKKENGSLTPTEDAQFNEQYNVLNQKLNSIIPSTEKDKYFNDLQLLNKQFVDYSKSNQGAIDEYSNLVNSYNKLSDAQKKSVNDFPEIKEEFAKIKKENEEAKNSSLFGANAIGNISEELWNAVYDSSAGIITTVKDIVSSQLPETAQINLDAFSNKFKEFSDDYFRAVTSDLPIFENGELKNPSQILPMIAKTAADMGLLLYGANKFSALSKTIGATKTANNIGLITSSIIQTYDDYKTQALQNGWTDEDATKFGLQSAFLTSALETISPNMILRGTTIEKKALGDAIKTLNSKKGYTSFFNSVFSEVPKELKQEFSQLVGDKISAYVANQMTNSPEKLDTDITLDEVLETGLLTSAVTMLAGGTVGRKNEKQLQTQAIIESAKDFPKFQQLLKQQLDNGQITQEKYDEIFNKVSVGVMALNKMPQDLSEKKKADILPLLSEKIELEQKVKELDSAFKPIYEKNLQVIDEQIQNILNIKEDDSKEQERVSSEEQVGKEPEQTQPEFKESEKEVATSGVLQTQKIKNPTVESTKVVTKQPIIEPEKPSLLEFTEEEITEDLIKEQEEETDMLLGGEGEVRRKKGSFIQNGITYKRNEKTTGAKGASGNVRFSDKVLIPFTYKLIESDELQPSHIGGIRNPLHFLPEAQPKSRTDKGSISAEEGFATAPRFSEMGKNTNAYSGAPVVNDRGEVIQGNNRSAGLKKGYKRGSVIYKDELIANAEKFGFTKEQVMGMNNPILVREVKTHDEGSIELGNYDVKDLETGGKSRLNPQSVSRRIPFAKKGDMLSVLFKGTDETINKSLRTNFKKIFELISPFLNQSQRDTIQKDGDVTANGIEDLEGVIKSFLFEGGDIDLPEIFEGLSHTQKMAIQNALPYIFSVDNKKSLLRDLQNSIIAVYNFNENGNGNFDEWLNQLDMFSGATPKDIYTPIEIELAKKIINVKSQKDLANLFKDYYSLTKDKEADMFEEAKLGITKKDAIKQLFNVEYNEKQKNKIGAGSSKKISGTTNKEEPSKTVEAKVEPEQDEPKQEVNSEPKQEPKQPEPTGPTEPKKEHMLGKRVVLSESLPEEIKSGLKKKGIDYIPVGMDVTSEEAKGIIDSFESMDNGLESLEKHIYNTTNGIKPSVRTTLLQQYVSKLINKRVSVTEDSEKERLSDKITDLMYFAQKWGAEGGRAINMEKLWQKILGKLPGQAVKDVQKRIDKRNSTVSKQYESEAAKAKAIIDEYINSEEYKKRVEEEIEAEFKKYAEEIYEKDSLDKLDDALAKLQDAMKGMAFEATLGVPVAVLNGAIGVIRKALRVGKNISVAIKLAIDYIKSNYSGEFNEKKFTEVAEQFIKDLKLKKKKGKKELTEDEIKEKVNNIREKILKRKLKELEEYFKDPELYEKKLEEKLNKAKAEKSDEVKKLEEELKEKRDLFKAQRKLKELDFLPENKVKDLLNESLSTVIEKGYISDIDFKNKFAKQLGLEHLTDNDIKLINELANTISDYDKAVTDFMNDPSKEKIQALKKAMYEGRVANKKLSNFYRSKKTILGALKTGIQGNLLTTSSLVANVGYNISNFLPNLVSKAIGSSLDYIRVKLSEATGLEKIFGDKDRRIDFLAYYRGAKNLEGSFEGLKEGIKELYGGTVLDTLSDRDTNVLIEPGKAWASFFKELSSKEKKNLTKILGAFSEGTFMFAPEMMFRLLNLGDKPFRKAAEYGTRSEMIVMRLNKLRRELENKTELTDEESKLLEDIQSGKEYTKQFYNPDEKTLIITEEEGKKATFQQKSIISKLIDKADLKNEDDKEIAKITKGILKLLSTTQFPYINTPTNIIIDMMKYSNPLIGISAGAYKASNGDLRGAQQDFSKAIVGQIIVSAAMYLIENGIIGADDSEEKQERDIEYTIGEPRMINWSLWERKMNGETSNKWKEGDIKSDYSKIGIIGAIMFSFANMYKGKTIEEIKSNIVFDRMLGILPETMRSAFESSFLQGTSTLLDAVKEGGYAADKWIVNTSRALGATFIPSTLGRVSNYFGDGYLKDVYNPDLKQWVINNYKNNLFMGDDLPTKIDVWGRPIKRISGESPTGEFIYNMFDFTKTQTVQADPTGYNIYYLWKRTGNRDALPDVYPGKLTIGDKEVQLSREQREDIAKIIGEKRRRNVAIYIQSEEWDNATDEQRIDDLKVIYNKSKSDGINEFKEKYNLGDIKKTKKEKKKHYKRSASIRKLIK